jgi:MFS family permease
MSNPNAAPRSAPVFVVGTLVGLPACMAATRVAATLSVLTQGYPEWTVGALLSLYGLAPIALSMFAGRTADRHGFHKPVLWAVIAATAGALLALVSQHVVVLAVSGLATGVATAFAAAAIQREAGQMAHDASDLKRVFSWPALPPAIRSAWF